MSDKREKVISGLEWCLFKTGCNGCPYRNDCDDGTNMEKDALALLKAQEPVKPKIIGIYYVCGQCGMRTVGHRKAQTNDVLKVSNYCPDCGRAVKWE